MPPSKHALLSASSSHRWLNCPPSARLGEDYEDNGNRGIACGLNNLQKIRDGEPLGGKASAESDFDTDDDDDFLA